MNRAMPFILPQILPPEAHLSTPRPRRRTDTPRPQDRT